METKNLTNNVKKRPRGDTRCAIVGCNSVKRINNDLMFFKFPEPNTNVVKFISQDEEFIMDRKKAWEHVTNRKCTKSKCLKVCSLHFTKDDFILPDFVKQKKLKKTAVPSQLLTINKTPTSDNISNNIISETEYIATRQPKSKNQKLVSKKNERTEPKTVGDFVIEDMECPEKVQLMYTIAKKEIEENNKTLDDLYNENIRLEKRVETLERLISQRRKELKMFESNSDDIDNIETKIPVHLNTNEESIVTKIKIESDIEIEEHELQYPDINIKEEIDPPSSTTTITNFEFVSVTPKIENDYYNE